ncbi:DUF7832 domain-containing protein [Occallatibacter riparius]|uniref:DUF7832 domain-containing protein n=1 Tax=Occallatibacter riparius TaxID=1002689 RepID=A0A9J7BTI0_9BACT|nr:hypothetical protein [Occallatibacter riparius]UWZ86180.1 hypothetical protein MOP44_09600 [Occallatibacter riparius]
MKYDDASWHYGGNFPSGLPDKAGATHAGMFVAWALLSGLAGELIVDEFPQFIEKLRDRSLTPGQLFFNLCDGKFIDEDLNDVGNAFAQDYFNFQKGKYLKDYEATLGEGAATLYHVADSWENFDRLKPVLDRRFTEWKAK